MITPKPGPFECLGGGGGGGGGGGAFPPDILLMPARGRSPGETHIIRVIIRRK